LSHAVPILGHALLAEITDLRNAHVIEFCAGNGQLTFRYAMETKSVVGIDAKDKLALTGRAPLHGSRRIWANEFSIAARRAGGRSERPMRLAAKDLSASLAAGDAVFHDGGEGCPALSENHCLG